MAERGKYIVIEGHDGTGKGVQTNLLRERLAERNIETTTVVEPGETLAGAKIREIVKNAENALDGYSNILLFTANRRDIWQKKILPSIEKGLWVVGDRNWFSTVAYQVYGQNSGNMTKIDYLTQTYVDPQYARPDLAVVLNLDERRRTARIEQRGEVQDAPDAFETQDADFQVRVALGYLAVAEATGAHVVEALGEPLEIHKRIWKLVEPLIER